MMHKFIVRTKKLTVLFAVTKTIFYWIHPQSFINDHISCINDHRYSIVIHIHFYRVHCYAVHVYTVTSHINAPISVWNVPNVQMYQTQAKWHRHNSTVNSFAFYTLTHGLRILINLSQSKCNSLRLHENNQHVNTLVMSKKLPTDVVTWTQFTINRLSQQHRLWEFIESCLFCHIHRHEDERKRTTWLYRNCSKIFIWHIK